MNRADVLQKILELNIFYESGKLNRHRFRLIEQDVELVAAIFQCTSGCSSLELKDRVYWIIHGLDEYPTCRTCKQKIVENIKNFSSTLAERIHCSGKCRLSDPEFQSASRRKLLATTGYDHPLKNPKTREKVKKTNLERYGTENVFQNSEIKQKIKDTVIERYGVENPSQSLEIQERRKETFQERYGVDNAQRVEEFKQKARETCLQRYGTTNFGNSEESREKARQTNLDRYGEIYPSHTEKGRATSMERYGVPHPMQHDEIFKKVMRARFKIKRYISKSGREYFYQGYENAALSFLINYVNVPEDWIINRVSEVPKILYLNRLTNGISRYYPDIFIDKINWLIEVKSSFTFEINKEITFDKQRAAREAGYVHMIFICDKKKVIEAL